MADRTTPLKPLRGGSEQAEDSLSLRQEIARRDEEILRLRDLLIARDAELGAARGRQAELEQHARHLLGILGLLQRVPGAMRLARAVLRRLQGRRGRAGG